MVILPVLVPLAHAALAALITSWDVLPDNSKAFDLLPPRVLDRLGTNRSSVEHVAGELFREWWSSEPDLNPHVALTWVNGINYTNAEMQEQADFLSTMFGCKVRPYYNPSLGTWFKDLTRVSYMYIRSPIVDPVVTGLADHLRSVLHEVGPEGRVVHLSHSGGALLTYLVAKYHLKEEERGRIEVINFGGAWSITRKYFGRAVNYYARNDPILIVNKRAQTLMKKAVERDQEVMYLKHNTSFVFLQGRGGSPLADHSFIGPTYLEALEKEAVAFRRRYARMWLLRDVRTARPADMTWTRYMRKGMAAATGFHGFFSRGAYSNMTTYTVLTSRLLPSNATLFANWTGPVFVNFNGTIFRFKNASVAAWYTGMGTRLQNLTAVEWRMVPTQNMSARHVRKAFARMTGRHHFFGRAANITVIEGRWTKRSSTAVWFATAQRNTTMRRMRKYCARMTGRHHFFAPRITHLPVPQNRTAVPPVDQDSDGMSPPVVSMATVERVSPENATIPAPNATDRANATSVDPDAVAVSGPWQPSAVAPPRPKPPPSAMAPREDPLLAGLEEGLEKKVVAREAEDEAQKKAGCTKERGKTRADKNTLSVSDVLDDGSDLSEIQDLVERSFEGGSWL